jgi:steroid delta-isomerase-like uncharacterized protein
MIEALSEMAARNEDVLRALTRLNNGESEEAIADFAEDFCFNDRGLGLEFNDREQLREFLQKERALYPDSSFQVKNILVAEDHVIAEWLLEYTIKEPFYGNTLRDVPVSLHGISVIRISKGKVTEWSDYYDGLTSRRTGLASYFTEWIEY